MEVYLTACAELYRIISLLGHGKGGYSYLAEQDGESLEPCLPQVREMAEQAGKHGLNIDYFPTNVKQ